MRKHEVEKRYIVVRFWRGIVLIFCQINQKAVKKLRGYVTSPFKGILLVEFTTSGRGFASESLKWLGINGVKFSVWVNGQMYMLERIYSIFNLCSNPRR